MKKKLLHLLLSGTVLFACSTVHAQISPSDNPSNWHYAPSTLTHRSTQSTQSVICNPPSVNGPVSLCDSGIATLTATGALNYEWFSNLTGGSPIASTPSYTTPMLYSSAAYYAAAVCDSDTAMMDVSTQSSTFAGNVRGYWFTAPCNFTITGVRVPLDNTGAQTIQILRFTAGPPPAYASTTNSFVSLGYWNTVNTTTVIDTNIAITAGDVIGIYGWRGTTVSYGPAMDYTSSIDGHAVVLQRSGMQFDLNTAQMHDVWSEAAGSIGRVEMYYTVKDTSTRVADSVLVTACTGIITNTSEIGVSVFPNPTNNQVNITLHGTNGNSLIQLLDVTGRILEEQMITGNLSTFDLSSFAKGEYIIRVTNNNSIYVTKVARL